MLNNLTLVCCNLISLSAAVEEGHICSALCKFFLLLLPLLLVDFFNVISGRHTGIGTIDYYLFFWGPINKDRRVN